MKISSLIQFVVVRILHRMTARAMGVACPLHTLGQAALHAYADFTREQLTRIPAEELPAVQGRMYQEARRMGSLLRKVLFLRSDSRARQVVFWLYRRIGIRLEGDCPGQIRVCCCFFSDYYSPQMCRVMSAMDRGIFAGLFGGGELTFFSRITEGHACCLAAFGTERKMDER